MWNSVCLHSGHALYGVCVSIMFIILIIMFDKNKVVVVVCVECGTYGGRGFIVVVYGVFLWETSPSFWYEN